MHDTDIFFKKKGEEIAVWMTETNIRIFSGFFPGFPDFEAKFWKEAPSAFHWHMTTIGYIKKKENH